MIRPKYETLRPSKADEADAYEIATMRDMGVCQRCRRDCGPFNRDHRQNRRPGNTRASNLQGLGGSGTTGCHGWKTTHPKEALEEGWACPSWAIPAEWPARRYLPNAHRLLRAAWVLYGDDGSVTEISEAEAMRRMGRES
ncbi:MAG: hypothetical protein JWP32_2871 [Schumannella sp.]|nr:hypothetical protein [Schumannella sp.]